MEKCSNNFGLFRNLKVFAQSEGELVRIERLNTGCTVLARFEVEQLLGVWVCLVSNPPNIVVKLFMSAEVLLISRLIHQRIILLLIHLTVGPDLAGKHTDFTSVLVNINELFRAKNLPHDPLLVNIMEKDSWVP